MPATSASRLTDESVTALAVDLLGREADARCGLPLTAQYPELTLADAYRVQRQYVDHRVAAGARIIGHKVGCTNAELQRQFGIDQPDYGHLLDDMILDDGAAVELDHLIQPRIEPELAFILDRDFPDPGVTARDVLGATRGVVPCFEVIDSRIRDWTITIADTIADNGSSARVVLGTKTYSADDADLRSLGVALERNGVVEATGTGASVLGHPAQSVAWLANALVSRGTHLGAGQLVLSGALTRSIEICRGDTVYGDFGTLGVIRCRVT